MRLFVAVDLDSEIRKKVTEIQNTIRRTGSNVKFVKPENLHFTVKFLGEVPDERAKEIGTQLCESVSEFGSFDISVEGFGYFGSPRHVKTLWLGVKKGENIFLNLMKAVNSKLKHVKMNRYAPSVHLTTGRVRSGENREKLLREIKRMKNVKVGEMTVKNVKLKKSVLDKTGPEYSDVKVCKLR